MLNSTSGILMERHNFDATVGLQNASSASTHANPLDPTAGLSTTTNNAHLQHSSSSGTGLQAQYYQGQDFTDLKLSRIDPTIDFNWASGSPDASLGSDNYSIRWIGQIQPNFAETYTFYTSSDDGIRLWVDGQLLIDNWSDHAQTEDSGSIALASGQKYDIKLEYYEHGGDSVAKLLWSSPSQVKEIIPQSQLHESINAVSPPSNSPSQPQNGNMLPSTGNSNPIPPPGIVQNQPSKGSTAPSSPSNSSSAGNQQNTITATVDWNTVKGTTSLRYGLNAFQGFRSQSFNDPTYQSNLSFMSPGLIRFHNGGALQDSSTPDGLIDTARRTWDADKVRDGLAASVATFGANQPERMMNIPTWPSWMDADNDGFLDRNQFDNFAQLCADLVTITNENSQFDVKYWEVTNEKDDHYFTQFHTNGGWGGLKDPAQPDRLDELVTIYNKAAVAMKKADPSIMVGGPGIARADLQPFYVPFMQGTVDNLDFFTYHFYATGSASTPDQEVYNSSKAIGDYTATMVQRLQEISPNRKIPVMLGEYNISWTWETRDPRMTNHKGVVFDALGIVRALESGAATTLSWNEKDGIYGKMGDNNELRPGATFLHLLNTLMVGDRVASTSSNENAITTLAVSNQLLGYKSYLIINHSDSTQQVQADFNGWKPGTQNLSEYEISASGYTEATTNWNDITDGIDVSPHSVTLLTFTN